MKNWEKYISRHEIKPLIYAKPDTSLNFIVVIPCYNEKDIFSTIQSLQQSSGNNLSIEIIVVINSSEESSNTVNSQNEETYQQLIKEVLKINTKKFKLHPILKPNLPKKHAGVGLARKIGMDEAVLRFKNTGNYNGVIISLDADTIVDGNYIASIANCFKNEQISGANIHFEHPTHGNEFSDNVYSSIVLYEIYLRYFKNAIKFTGFPYAYHTIGSAFAVRANTYINQGGMSKNKGGEDFYFLHKIFPGSNFQEIVDTTVHPSPRLSDRVPFGTGPALNNHLSGKTDLNKVYNFKIFQILHELFTMRADIWNNAKDSSLLKISKTHKSIETFVIQENIIDKLQELKDNCSSQEIFTKRFFEIFNAFSIVKYCNYASEHYFERQNILSQSILLLNKLGVNIKDEVNEKKILDIFRAFDKASLPQQ